MTREEIDREINRVKGAISRTKSENLRRDYGKYLKKLYRLRKKYERG